MADEEYEGVYNEVRTDKITSIAELKEAIGKIRAMSKGRAPFPQGQRWGFNQAVDKINEFEASVRERIAEVENKTPKHVGGHFHPVSELRRVLGEEVKE